MVISNHIRALMHVCLSGTVARELERSTGRDMRVAA
jgi:hypothetical protein